MFGQPELDEKLSNPVIRQLKQRITFSCRLRPLNFSDVEFYIAHRMGIAGYRGSRAFSVASVKRLFRASGGVPRLINVLAHKSLIAAFGEGAAMVEERHVRLAVADTESIQGKPSLKTRLVRYLAALTAMVTLVSISAQLWIG